MGLRSYILKRSIYSLVLVLFVVSLNFLIFQMMPGSPLESLLDPSLTDEQVEAIIRDFGLDPSIPLHEKFGKYALNTLTFNFGVSFWSKKPVSSEIGERLGNTLLLMGAVTALSIAVGVILGVVAASRRGGLFDSISVLGSLTTYSLPSFWMGMIAIYIFAYKLDWFPAGGTYPWTWAVVGTPSNIFEVIQGRLMHIALPTMTLFLFSYGGWLLLTRATIGEVLTEDYITTARAKGLKERTVLFKHALKNASLPLITSGAMSFGFLISGAVITEQVFGYRGLGSWIWWAIYNHDFPVMQGFFFVIALCVIMANFIADMLYGVIDPRIKYG